MNVLLESILYCFFIVLMAVEIVWIITVMVNDHKDRLAQERKEQSEKAEH
ncbi:hypothetical protein [Galactobacillus timonensis]|nr:hypothetical protein [Galactobacillus timonensis]